MSITLPRLEIFLVSWQEKSSFIDGLFSQTDCLFFISIDRNFTREKQNIDIRQTHIVLLTFI